MIWDKYLQTFCKLRSEALDTYLKSMIWKYEDPPDLLPANLGVTVGTYLLLSQWDCGKLFSTRWLSSIRKLRFIRVLAQEIFDSTWRFLGSLKRKGHAVVFSHNFLRGWPETYSFSFIPEESIELFSPYKRQIYCYGESTLAIVVGDATKIVFENNSIRETHYCSDRGYADWCEFS